MHELWCRGDGVEQEQVAAPIVVVRTSLSESSLQSSEIYADLQIQNPNGSWPVFSGDDNDGSWTTALATIALRDVVPTAFAIMALDELPCTCGGLEQVPARISMRNGCAVAWFNHNWPEHPGCIDHPCSP
jgi:hypothetical protein